QATDLLRGQVVEQRLLGRMVPVERGVADLRGLRDVADGDLVDRARLQQFQQRAAQGGARADRAGIARGGQVLPVRGVPMRHGISLLLPFMIYKISHLDSASHRTRADSVISTHAQRMRYRPVGAAIGALLAAVCLSSCKGETAEKAQERPALTVEL